MSVRPEDELLDPSLQSDIELFGTLVAAVSEAGRPLTQPEIDLALGVEPKSPTDALAAGPVAAS